VAACASDIFTWALAVAICARTCATLASSPLTRPASLHLLHCARAPAICAVSSLTLVWA
jgi:hypothetical protein